MFVITRSPSSKARADLDHEPRVFGLFAVAGAEKEMLLASDPETFFTEPHNDGFPSILIRLEAIDLSRIR